MKDYEEQGFVMNLKKLGNSSFKNISVDFNAPKVKLGRREPSLSGINFISGALNQR